MKQNATSLSQALIAGSAGAFLAWLAGMPAPFLTGPAIAVTLAGLGGFKPAIPIRLRDAAFVVIGLSMGSGVTPDVLNAISRWPVSLLALLVSIVVMMVLSRRALMQFAGSDARSAILCATPGHLSYVLAMAEQQKLDVRLIGVVQSIRVLFLTLAVPAVVAMAGLEAPLLDMGREQTMDLLSVVILILLAGGVGWLFKHYHFPAAYLLAGMLVSTVTHLGGLVVGELPPSVSVPAFVLLGTLIGTRFSGVSMNELRRSLFSGVIVTVISVGVTILISAAAAALTGLPLASLLIALSPGGVETMIAMSRFAGADPAFVAAHHLARLVFLAFFVPLVLMREDKSGHTRSY